MEKLEWREAFQRQPAYYLFIDLTAPMSANNLNAVCQVLQDMTTLSVSLKGSLRFHVLGIYALSNKMKCVFPMQSVKNNYTKLQYSIESMQNTTHIFTGKETFDIDKLAESLQAAVQQYETYYQGAVPDKEEWPQLQIVYFSAQPRQMVIRIVEESLSTIELGYIRKIQIVMLRGRNFSSSFNTSDSKSDTQQPSSQAMFDNEEKESIIRSLLHVTEIEANSYHLESIMKSWLHDCCTDSDHLRLTVDKMVLRCDLRECLLRTDSLPVTGQFFLFPDASPTQHAARVNPSVKQSCAIKVPVYTLEAITIIRKEGLCESLLFGHPVIAVATRCWKMDWDELERNQQQFAGLVRYLSEKNLVLLAKRQTSPIMATDKTLPSGFFAFFPARHALLVKSVASKELLLPLCDLQEKEIPEDVELEIRECIANLEEKEIYNPLSVASGLYSFLSSSISKIRPRPSTSFVVPTINRDESADKKTKKCSVLPVVEVCSRKQTKSSFQNDFLTASAIYRKNFPHNLE